MARYLITYRKNVFLIAFLLIKLSVNAQVERVENDLMNCWLNSFNDNGEKAKNHISYYEQLLFEENILSEVSPDGYVSMLRNIVSSGDSADKPSESFFNGINDLNENFEGYDLCRRYLIGDSINYDSKTLNIFEMRMEKTLKSDTLTRSSIAEVFLSVLSKEDFNFYYYRLRVFIIFDFIILSDFFKN